MPGWPCPVRNSPGGRASAENAVRDERLFRRRAGEALHPGREPVEARGEARRAPGEYNFAGQYQQSPAPLDGGVVKRG